jgi:hypothetical protein
MERQPPAALAALSLASLAGFVVVSQLARKERGPRSGPDARDARFAADTSVDGAASRGGWLHAPVAAGISLYLGTRTGVPRAVIPALASMTADAVTRVLDRALPLDEQPSGEASRRRGPARARAIETTAVAFTTAYALAREHLLTPSRGFGLAAGISTMTAAGRLYLGRHWGSDAAAGALLGLSVAAAYAAIAGQVRRHETRGAVGA